MTTWFISDLHLDPQAPHSQASLSLLLGFLEYLQQATDAEALYILGDLFEYWIGDDVLDTPLGQAYQAITQALRVVTMKGLPVYFQHGNRDFLLGEYFAQQTGITLLPETHVISLYGQATLMMHGDTLCTDDVDYQQARLQFRNPEWQQHALRLSIPERLQLAKSLRQQSQDSMEYKSAAIMDVNAQAVIEAMQTHGVTQLIHGHTHRPAIHTLHIQQQAARRIVLGDWHEKGSFLRVNNEQLRLQSHYNPHL